MADAATVADSVPDVLSEIHRGEGLSLAAAGRLFPGHRGGNSVYPSTVFRWVVKGSRTPTGASVRLDAVRVGGRWLTSRAAVARFVAALTAAVDPAPTDSTPAVRPPSARRKSADRAARELERRGA